MARAECRVAFIVAFTLCFSQCQSWGITRRLSSGHGDCPCPSSSHRGGGGGHGSPTPSPGSSHRGGGHGQGSPTPSPSSSHRGGGDGQGSPTQENKEGSSHEKEDATHRRLSDDDSCDETEHATSGDDSCDETENATQQADEVEHGSRRLDGHNIGTESGDGNGPTTDVSLALAYAAILYVVFIMVVLYFLNYDCAFIRSASYKMLCTAISVYCAVLINTAIMGFVVDQLIKGEGFRGFGVGCIGFRGHALMGGLLSIFFLIATNAGCHHYKLSHHKLKAVGTLGAHLTAFAGIHAFSHIQNSEKLLKQYSLQYEFVVCIAIVVTAFVFYVSRFIRQKSLDRKLKHMERDHKGDYDMLEAEKLAAKHDGEGWREEVSEAEGEAGGLVVGFLVMQVSIFVITGNKVSAHGDSCVHDPDEIAFLAFIGLHFAALVVVQAYIRTALHHQFPNNAAFKENHTSALNLRNNFKMSMAWCWARSTQWIMLLVLPIPEEAWFAAALLASAVAIGWVLLMNIMMDRTSARKFRLEKWERFLSVKGIENFSKLALLPDERNKLPAAELKAIDNFELKTPADKSFETTGEHAVASLTTGFAVLIGLAWDKAFETAEAEILKHDNLPDWLKEHKVLPKICLAFVLVGVVLPGWAMYIIPAAQKEERIHFLNIFKARAQKIEEDTKSPEFNNGLDNKRTNEQA